MGAVPENVKCFDANPSARWSSTSPFLHETNTNPDSVVRAGCLACAHALLFHELYLLLLGNRLRLVPDYLRNVLGVVLPEFLDASEVSANLVEVQPAEYRADKVIRLSNEKGEAVHLIIVEVQLSRDPQKVYSWPAYVANLRAKWKCPVSMLVVTADERTADWAAKGFEIDSRNRFTPFVSRPSEVPMIADEAQARENPELAVFSVMAHGRDENVERVREIVVAAARACADLDSDRSKIYGDIICSFTSEEARSALDDMPEFKLSPNGAFAQFFFGAGKAAGVTEESRRLLRRQLTARFGPLDLQTESRIQRASADRLDAIWERLHVARTLIAAMGESDG